MFGCRRPKCERGESKLLLLWRTACLGRRAQDVICTERIRISTRYVSPPRNFVCEAGVVRGERMRSIFLAAPLGWRSLVKR